MAWHARSGGAPRAARAGHAASATSRSRPAGAANKLRELSRSAATRSRARGTAKEAITLLADLDAGATGAMTGGGYPDGIRTIVDPYAAGDREAAARGLRSLAAADHFENRTGGLLTAKALIRKGGIGRCRCAAPPVSGHAPGPRAGLLDAGRAGSNPLVMRWRK